MATGRVIFYDGEDRITGDRIDYNIRSGTGVVHHARAETAPYYRVAGERMERVGDSVYRIRKGVFTTCEGDSPAWSFRFDEATADLEDYVYGTGGPTVSPDWLRTSWLRLIVPATRMMPTTARVSGIS